MPRVSSCQLAGDKGHAILSGWWRPHFPTKLAAAASFSYKIGGGGLILLQNWRLRPHFPTQFWRWQGFGNITFGCSDISDMVRILEKLFLKFVILPPLFQNELFWSKFCPRYFRKFGQLYIQGQNATVTSYWIMNDTWQIINSCHRKVIYRVAQSMFIMKIG